MVRTIPVENEKRLRPIHDRRNRLPLSKGRQFYTTRTIFPYTATRNGRRGVCAARLAISNASSSACS